MRVHIQDEDWVAFPDSGSTGWCGHLGFRGVDVFWLGDPILACPWVLPLGRWSLWVEMLPSSSVAVPCSLPVLVRSWNATSGGLEPMLAVCSEVILSFSLLHFKLCVFYYCYCLRLISHGWIICFLQAVGIDQLVWVCADGDGPAVVVLLVSWCGSAGRRDFGFPRHSLRLSANCIFYYYFFIVLICSCILFPGSAYPSVLCLPLWGGVLLLSGCYLNLSMVSIGCIVKKLSF